MTAPPVPDELTAIRAFKRMPDGTGTSGQPSPEQLVAIAAAGYEVVINLVPPDQRLLPEEAEIVRGLGLDYVNIPVVWTAPTPENLQTFFGELDARPGRRIFVHCAANLRASAFLYLYRVLRRGDDPDDAEQDLLDLWTPTDWWQAFIDSALHRVA
jgi:protein tyrosine phosphatase (PTP) superfamily phosphohydrolase (DUF442 family)